MTEGLGLAESLRVHVTKSQKQATVGQHPVKPMIRVPIDRIAPPACIPNPMQALYAGADGSDRLPHIQVLEQPVKQDFAVIFSFDVLGPGPQRSLDFTRNVERAVVNKQPGSMAKGLRMRQPDQFASREFERVRRPAHMA